jgi:hypothetical protein
MWQNRGIVKLILCLKNVKKNIKIKLLTKLVYNSDVVAAWKLTGDQKYRDMLEQAEKDNVTVSDFTPIAKDEDAYSWWSWFKIN